MSIKTLLQNLNHKPIAYYPIYREIAGSTASGILLSQLMYWLAIKDKIYKTDAEIMQETLLSPKELRTAKQRIKELNFIKVSVEGVPAKTYYEIDWNILYTVLSDTNINKNDIGRNKNSRKGETRIAERAKLDTPKGRNKNSRKGETITENTTENTTETTTENKKITKKSFENFIKLVKELFSENKIATFTNKINKTKDTKEAYSLLGKNNFDLDKVANAFVEYIRANKNKASRLDIFLNAMLEDKLMFIDYSNKFIKNIKEGDYFYELHYSQYSNNNYKISDVIDVEAENE